MSSNLYRIVTYFSVKNLHMGAVLFQKEEFVALSFEEAYQMLKNQVWKDPKEENAPNDPEAPRKTLFASRIVCYDMEGDGQPVQSWCFDQRNAFYSGTCPTPMSVPKATEESWEWTVGMVVGFYHKSHLMFGIIREIMSPSEGHTFPLFAVDLAYTDSDGALKRVVCDASHFLPYPHSAVEEWNKNYFDEMIIDDELMEKIISRTRIVEKYPYPLSHEAPLISPKPDEDFLSYFYELSKIEALGEIEDGVKKSEIFLGFFNTAEQARAAMMRDVSTRKDGDPPVFYYDISMWGRSRKIEYWGNLSWIGHWCFDETGRLKGWSDMSSRPFLGRDPDECHFKIGDIVAFFNMDGIYRPGVVGGVPFGKEKAAKIGLDMSDDCYFVESAVCPESSHIPDDHLAEPRFLLFKGHLKDSTRRRFASYLINNEERASLRAKLKFPPSIIWNRESSQDLKSCVIGYEPFCKPDFYQLFLSGSAGVGHFYDMISKWHWTNTYQSLWQYLGMPEPVFRIFRKCPFIFEEVRRTIFTGHGHSMSIAPKDFEAALKVFLDECQSLGEKCTIKKFVGDSKRQITDRREINRCPILSNSTCKVKFK